MSCDWDIHCLECDKPMGLSLNHGSDLCMSLIKGREAFELLAKSLEKIRGYYEPLRVYGEIGAVDEVFFLVHKGHVLAPVSEYRDIGYLCNKASGHLKCSLLDEHACDHDFVDDDPSMWQLRRERALAFIKASRRHMTHVSGAESSLTTCPCGEKLLNDRFTRDSSTSENWWKEHQPHAPGGVEEICQGCGSRRVRENSKVMKDKILQINNYETSTRVCPCGATFTWSGFSDDLAGWMKEHGPHALSQEIEELTVKDSRRM